MPVRAAVAMLYLLTGFAGLYIAIQLTLTGMYGLPFSWWYGVVAVGSLILIIGAILVWASGRAWTEWIPLVGSALLASYFIPAIIVTLRRYLQGTVPGGEEFAIRVSFALLVLLSLTVTVMMKFHLSSSS